MKVVHIFCSNTRLSNQKFLVFHKNMANKFNKRGKLPRMIDSWLDSLGFYRKNIAYDETCLFRTVAEQVG